MFKNNELETLIKDKINYLYRDFGKYYKEDVSQDEIFDDFCKQLKTEDFIVNLIQDVRFTALVDDWLKSLTWKEILKNEIDGKLDYKKYFAVKNGSNQPHVYQDYLEGNVKENVKALCYAHDIAEKNDKIKLELAFPLLFNDKEILLDSLKNK